MLIFLRSPDFDRGARSSKRDTVDRPPPTEPEVKNVSKSVRKLMIDLLACERPEDFISSRARNYTSVLTEGQKALILRLLP